MSLARTRILIVVLAALAVAIFGATRLFATFGGQAQATVQVASLDSMTAQVTRAAWVEMDHDMSGTAPGYQMPPAMMPGMPEQGNQRVSVAVTVSNTSDQTRQLRPGEEFTLRVAKGGKQWTAHSHTFGELPRLAPHTAVTGTLFFDLPPADLADSATWVEWSHQDSSARLFVPLNGAAPDHQHNP